MTITKAKKQKTTTKSIPRNRSRDSKTLKSPPIDLSALTQTNLTNGDKNEKRLKFSPHANSDTEHNSDSSIVSTDACQNTQQFQTDTPKVSNNNNAHTMVTDNSPTNLTASITELKDHTATFIDIDSVKGYIKQKYLQSNIINPMQSYLYVFIEQGKNDW